MRVKTRAFAIGLALVLPLVLGRGALAYDYETCFAFACASTFPEDTSGSSPGCFRKA